MPVAQGRAGSLAHMFASGRLIILCMPLVIIGALFISLTDEAEHAKTSAFNRK